MSALLDLAARCEAATGADRELDARIWLALHRPEYRYPSAVLNRSPDSYWEAVGRFTHDGMGGGSQAPDYTASLDAALSLVPEGLGIGWRMSDGAGGPTAEVWCIDLDTCAELYHVGAEPVATPALAMCAAALRARAASENPND